MCNRYVAPEHGEIERMWDLRGDVSPMWRSREVFPRAPGPFIRRARHETEPARELVVGQWGLVPSFAKTAKLTYSTNNARSEELAVKATAAFLLDLRAWLERALQFLKSPCFCAKTIEALC
jgi:putative SOS response-associated peptidase YedK